MKKYYLLILSGAAVTGCAFLNFEYRDFILTLLLLILPFVDSTQVSTFLRRQKNPLTIDSVIMCLAIAMILADNPSFSYQGLLILIFVALPEEWFFRFWFLGALQERISSRNIANLLTSILFAIGHLPSQGLIGLLTFFPSLALGYTYQRRYSLIHVILLHLLFNLIYQTYIQSHL